MIDLAKGISSAKVLLVKVKCRLRDSKDLLVLQILYQGLTDKDTLRHIHGVKIFKHSVWTCTDGVQIS